MSKLLLSALLIGMSLSMQLASLPAWAEDADALLESTATGEQAQARPCGLENSRLETLLADYTGNWKIYAGLMERKLKKLPVDEMGLTVAIRYLRNCKQQISDSLFDENAAPDFFRNLAAIDGLSKTNPGAGAEIDYFVQGYWETVFMPAWVGQARYTLKSAQLFSELAFGASTLFLYGAASFRAAQAASSVLQVGEYFASFRQAVLATGMSGIVSSGYFGMFKLAGADELKAASAAADQDTLSSAKQAETKFVRHWIPHPPALYLRLGIPQDYNFGIEAHRRQFLLDLRAKPVGLIGGWTTYVSLLARYGSRGVKMIEMASSPTEVLNPLAFLAIMAAGMTTDYMLKETSDMILTWADLRSQKSNVVNLARKLNAAIRRGESDQMIPLAVQLTNASLSMQAFKNLNLSDAELDYRVKWVEAGKDDQDAQVLAAKRKYESYVAESLILPGSNRDPLVGKALERATALNLLTADVMSEDELDPESQAMVRVLRSQQLRDDRRVATSLLQGEIAERQDKFYLQIAAMIRLTQDPWLTSIADQVFTTQMRRFDSALPGLREASIQHQDRQVWVK